MGKMTTFNAEQRTRFTIYLHERREHIFESTDRAVAEMASQALGFRVSEGQVQNQRSAMGIKKSDDNAMALGKRMREIEDRVRALEILSGVGAIERGMTLAANKEKTK